MDLGELAVTLTELEVEIAWTEKDLTNAEQNDNPQMVANLEKRLKELYRLLEEKRKL
jgi:Mg2+ and Co2+ transporter CorA|tara:strand:- start:343 stop:513 length:171 start_codon:yes stop_codon:yes gene_type:complete